MSSTDGKEFTIFYTTNDFNLGFNCDKLMRNILLSGSIDTILSIPHSHFEKIITEVYVRKYSNNFRNTVARAKVATLLKLSCFDQPTGDATQG